MNLPKVGDEVELLVYIGTAINDFELHPGDHGRVSEVDEDTIRIEVVYTMRYSDREIEDYIYVPTEEAHEYLKDIFL